MFLVAMNKTPLRRYRLRPGAQGAAAALRKGAEGACDRCTESAVRRIHGVGRAR